MIEQNNEETHLRTITTLDLAQQEAYWLKVFYGQLPTLDALFDHPRPVTQAFLRASESLSLDDNSCLSLLDAGQREGVPLSTLLLAALQIVLMRHAAQQSIIIGSLSYDSLRLVKDRQEQFLNPVALRLDAYDDPSARALLEHITHIVTEASAHRDYPFDLLTTQINSQSGGQERHLFQAIFVPLDEAGILSALPITREALSNIQHILTDCDLVFLTCKQQGGLQVECEYDAELFEATTIRSLLEHLRCVLADMAKRPLARFSELQLLSEEEHRRLLIDWNHTRTSYEENDCLHMLFERQAQRTPDAIAVVSGDVFFTYHALERHSHQLALLLQKHGSGPDTLIGLFVTRSLEMVVGILAILKSGAAYVPLDPSLPMLRLAMLLEDTQTPLVLTQSHLVPLFPDYRSQLILIDQVELAEEPSEALLRTVCPDNLACVLYTSGSTGRPKGVMLPHRVLTNLLLWHQASLIGQARTLQFASSGFDQSIHEMFAAWISGGMLYLLSEELRADPSALADYLVEQQIEKVFLPIVMLQRLAEIYSARSHLPEQLKEVLATGEQLRVTHQLRQLFTQLPDCTLYNHYGPTEAHVVTTCQLSKDPTSWPDLPPIGRPIANVQIYLLDQSCRPVPIGVPGELCISGDCLARGYWRQPQFTAESFLPNPYAHEQDPQTLRTYHTGDLARYLPDGNLEFLGRLDHQIKIRGMRVEPGEIEAILTTHVAVREAVVTLHKENANSPLLVAYVVPREGASLTAKELRHFLEAQVPAYMVPTAFVLLASLPLNHNGKVDRQALPLPDGELESRESVFVGPRTPLEEKLVAIWSQLLWVKQIGVYDNFFALGGHSLLGAQLIALIRNEFQVELTHFEIFENPTIAGQAETIEDIRLVAQLEQGMRENDQQDEREEIEM
ncbi:MAG TPA: amino acid adenylation domain-containing protein [Ktedonobacteraceae bacterium]|nr:amino acid adenylation domain-containing protein [Ktedonobacteraceae bacterium]